MTCPIQEKRQQLMEDGSRAGGGGQTERVRDEALGSLPMIAWSYWPFSAPQLAAELADRRPILHLAKERVKARAINGNKCWVLLLL